MTPNISDLRQALADTISAGTTIQPLYTYGNVVETIELPAAVVEPYSGDFVVTLNRGLDTFDFNIFVLVSRADPTSAQPVLDSLVSGTGQDSIRMAIYNNPTLGLGAAVEATVHSMKGYGGSLEGYGLPHIGAVLQVQINVSNSS